MDLQETLRSGCFLRELKSDTKVGIIEEMLDLLARAGKVKDRKAALDALLEREKRMSTGLQNGVAIPHAKLESVDPLIAAVALKKEGVDFKSLDGEPSQIFVMTLSSALRTGPHIQFLAEISRLLTSERTRKRLLSAESEEEMLRALTE